MKYICFRNEGTIEPELFKAFGVSVKESENPIGFFGTGLKYAIAVILRLGGQITICSGDDCFEFGVKQSTIRGKAFEFVSCNGETLGYTTDLGKTWEPWMAYRELRSNCLDEHGNLERHTRITPVAGETRIYVQSDDIERAHLESRTIFLESEPIFATALGEIHEGGSKFLYYRGVRVSELEKPSQFTFNLTCPIDLTEDRTVKYNFVAQSRIASTVARIDCEQLARRFFLSSEGNFERSLDFSSTSDFSETFMGVARSVFRSSPNRVNTSLQSAIRRHFGRADFTPCKISELDSRKLRVAKEFCEGIGFGVDPYTVVLVESLGDEVLALARPDCNEIIISRRVLDQGLKQLCSTLIEEVIHLREGLNDCSRAMQTFLFDRICSLGEEKLGVML